MNYVIGVSLSPNPLYPSPSPLLLPLPSSLLPLLPLLTSPSSSLTLITTLSPDDGHWRLLLTNPLIVFFPSPDNFPHCHRGEDGALLSTTTTLARRINWTGSGGKVAFKSLSKPCSLIYMYLTERWGFQFLQWTNLMIWFLIRLRQPVSVCLGSLTGCLNIIWSQCLCSWLVHCSCWEWGIV